MPDQATAVDLAPSGSACSRAAAMTDGATAEVLAPSGSACSRAADMSDGATGEGIAPSGSACSLAAAMTDGATAEDLDPSGSACSRAAAMSDGATVEEMMPAPWVILAAVPVNPPSSDKSDATVDFVLNLYEPPRVSSLTVSRRISTDSETSARFAYVVAVDPAGCFLLYATQGRAAPAYLVCDPHTSTASRLPDPAVGRPLRSFKSVGFVSYPGGSGGGSRYLIAHLQPADDTGGATLLRHWTGMEGWTMEEVKYSSPSESSPHWRSSTVVSNDGRLYWIDLFLGVITCNALLDYPELSYVPLPEGCDLPAGVPAGTADLDKRQHRWMGITTGKLTYLKVDVIHEPAFNLWTLTDQQSWNHQYKASFEEIWHSDSLKKIKSKAEDISIALVHPRFPEVIYFALGKKMHMVDLGARKTESSGMDEGVARPLSYFRAWELPGSLLAGIDSVSNHECTRSVANVCWQGVKLGQIMASQLGVGVASVGSNLLYLNQECSDAKMFFKHMSEYKVSGHGYAANATGKTARASKGISKILSGAESALSYGGKAFTSAGFSLQKLHPDAQTGGSARNAITEIITVESTKQADDLIQEWIATKQLVIAEVPVHMETDLAEKIMMLFKNAGALKLVENSNVLREKASRVLDDGLDWHMI